MKMYHILGFRKRDIGKKKGGWNQKYKKLLFNRDFYLVETLLFQIHIPSWSHIELLHFHSFASKKFMIGTTLQKGISQLQMYFS